MIGLLYIFGFVSWCLLAFTCYRGAYRLSQEIAQ